MKRLLGVIALLIVLFGAGAWVDREGLRDRFAPSDASKPPAPLIFFTPDNLNQLGRDAAIAGIYAIGAGLVIIAGGIDLSIGAVMAWAGVMAVWLMRTTTGTIDAGGAGWSPWLACPIVLGGCLLIGTIQGLLVTRVNLQPFIVTLAGMMLARGSAAVVTNGDRVSLTAADRDGNGFILLGTLLPKTWIMTPVVVAVIVAAAAIVFLHFTVWGRYLYAIGRNEQAALFSGVRVHRLRTLTYVISAGLAGLAGLLMTAVSEGSASYNGANGYELWAVAGAVLGGVSLRGGEGVVPGILLGALAFPLLEKLMSFLHITDVWKYVFVGIVLLGAVLLDEAIRRQEARKAAKKRAT